MATDLIQIIRSFSSPDDNIRKQAELTLNNAESTNLGEYICSLAKIVGNPQHSENDRYYAGVLIHQSLKYSNDDTRTAELQTKWSQMNITTKNEIKTLLSNSMTDSIGSKVASMALSSVGILELENHTWDELFPGINSAAAEDVKANCIQCLGYICEGLEQGTIEQTVINEYLSVIFKNMTDSSLTKARLAATIALDHSMEHIEENFKYEIQRNAIMEAICNAAVAEQLVEVQKSAYECLVHVAYLYYQYLAKYMDVIYKLTYTVFTKVDSIDENVVLMAIEFWSTLCETETELEATASINNNNENEGNNSNSNNNNSGSAYFIKNAFPTLVPALFNLAKFTDIDTPSDNWDVKAASAVCFSLIAKLVGNDILDVIFPLIQPCFTSADWKEKDAGLLFFGDLCECIDRQEFINTAVGSMPGFFILIQNDPCLLVKETAAWCLNKIFENYVEHIPVSQWADIISQLLSHLEMDSHIAYRACTSLYNIGHKIGEYQLEQRLNSNEYESNIYNNNLPETNILSLHFQVVVEKLLILSQNVLNLNQNNQNINNVQIENILIESYEAINSWIEFTGNNCIDLMRTILIHVLQTITVKIQSNSNNNVTIDSQTVLSIGLLHGTLQVLYQRLSYPNNNDLFTPQVLDTIINNALIILNSPVFASSYEDILLSLSSLISCVQLNILNYLPRLHSIICKNMKQFSDSNILSATVAIISDIAALGNDVDSGGGVGSGFLLTYAKDYIDAILICLQNNEVVRDIKPTLFSVLGDLADGIKDDFELFVKSTFEMCQGAINVTLDSNDPDELDYLINLRSGILDCLVGIFNSFSSNKLPTLLSISYDNVIEPLFNKIAVEPDISELLSNSNDYYSDSVIDMTKKACGLVGDLARLIPDCKPRLKQNASVETILGIGNKHEDQSLKKDANWALSELCKDIQKTK